MVSATGFTTLWCTGHAGNLLKVTEGPNAGKLALLDLGLVAEVPPADRYEWVAEHKQKLFV